MNALPLWPVAHYAPVLLGVARLRGSAWLQGAAAVVMPTARFHDVAWLWLAVAAESCAFARWMPGERHDVPQALGGVGLAVLRCEFVANA